MTSPLVDGPRVATAERTTKETSVAVRIDLDGPTGEVRASTGLPFFDHMLDHLGRHGGFDLTVTATGDLHVDGHHTVEDTGILVGETFREALGDKAGVRRFASASTRSTKRWWRWPSTSRGARSWSTTFPSVRCYRSATRPSTRRWASTSGTPSPPPPASRSM